MGSSYVSLLLGTPYAYFASFPLPLPWCGSTRTPARATPLLLPTLPHPTMPFGPLVPKHVPRTLWVDNLAFFLFAHIFHFCVLCAGLEKKAFKLPLWVVLGS